MRPDDKLSCTANRCGPRVGIGAGFAMAEAVPGLATLARHWHFVPPPGPEVELRTAITPRPRHGRPDET